jgi:hypothetical protein
VLTQQTAPLSDLSRKSGVDLRLAPTQIRRGEAVTASMWVGDATPSDWRVWQISGEGIELCEPDRQRARTSLAAPVDPPLSFARDTRVHIRLQVGSQRIVTSACVLSDDPLPSGRNRIRLRWIAPPWDEFETPWPCSRLSVPWGAAPHPAIFGRRLVFAVEAIGPQALEASLDADEELIFPGLVLTASLSFPGIATVACELEIKAVRGHPEHPDRMQAILTVNNASRKLSESIGQYLLQSGPWVTPRALRHASYHPTSIAQACTIRTANTHAERLEAVTLRTEAYAPYVAAGAFHHTPVRVRSRAHDRDHPDLHPSRLPRRRPTHGHDAGRDDQDPRVRTVDRSRQRYGEALTPVPAHRHETGGTFLSPWRPQR